MVGYGPDPVRDEYLSVGWVVDTTHSVVYRSDVEDVVAFDQTGLPVVGDRRINGLSVRGKQVGATQQNMAKQATGRSHP